MMMMKKKNERENEKGNPHEKFQKDPRKETDLERGEPFADAWRVQQAEGGVHNICTVDVVVVQHLGEASVAAHRGRNGEDRA